MTYVSMFPQLIAGPIVRFSTVNEELHNRVIDFRGFYQGSFRFLQGLIKKVLLANQMGVGGDDSWGAPVHSEYCFPANMQYDLRFTLMPVYKL